MSTPTTAPVVADLRNKHLDFYLDLAKRLEEGMESEHQEPWIELFETEEDNFRSALRWALDSRRIDDGIDIAFAISELWEETGRFSEWRSWLEQLVARDNVRPESRGKAMLSLWALLFNIGDYDASVDRAAEAAAAFEQAGDDEMTGYALACSAWGHWYAGRATQARALFERATSMLRGASRPNLLVHALKGLGWTELSAGEGAKALALHEEARAVLRELGNRRVLASFAIVHANIYSNLGDDVAVREMYEEAVDLERQLGNKRGVADNLSHLSWCVLRAPGEIVLAEELAGELLRSGRELALPSVASEALSALAKVAIHRRDLELAATLLSESLDESHRVTDPSINVLADRFVVLATMTELAILSGDQAAARRRLNECAELAKRLKFFRMTGASLRMLMEVAEEIDVEQAIAFAGQLDAFLVDTEEASWKVLAPGFRGWMRLLEGDHAGALEAARESVDLAVASGIDVLTGWARQRLGSVLLITGAASEAQSELELAVAELTHDAPRRAFTLHHLAAASAVNGDVDAAEAAVGDLGSEWRRLTAPRQVCTLIETIASVAAGRGRWIDAARAIGAAEYDRRTLHAPRGEWEVRSFDRCRAEVEAALGAEAYKAEYEEGVRLGGTGLLSAVLG